MNMTDIAKILKCSTETVRRICKMAIDNTAKDETKKPGRKSKLNAEQIRFLTSDDNLQRDCALTLDERAVRLHR